jgi:leucyl-tRNA---protein transferase
MHGHTRFLNDVIDDYFDASTELMMPYEFDYLLQHGWRLLGFAMIRHNFSSWQGQLCSTIPLRIDLSRFLSSKSQRQLMRRNEDLRVVQGPAHITEQKESLFFRHTTRFSERRPESLFNFINGNNKIPVPCHEITVYDKDRLIACSYTHIGLLDVSATYCFFEPDYHRRSLGFYTMLLELEAAKRAGKRYYYHGYCYDVPSQFDYKLNFNGLESMNWATQVWTPALRQPSGK